MSTRSKSEKNTTHFPLRLRNNKIENHSRNKGGEAIRRPVY